MTNIILASASPRREQLLREAGLRFRVMPAVGVNEELTGATPEVLAMRNAQRKAHAVAGAQPGILVIGADTIVALGGTVFGKPRDVEEAREFLRQLTGRWHEVLTGVAVVHRELDVEVTFAERTRVRMKPLDAASIAAYVDKVHTLDKAGAYAIQEHGDAIIEKIEGSYSNVMGLPMERLRGTLVKLGVSPV